jgi:hypothetical protein
MPARLTTATPPAIRLPDEGPLPAEIEDLIEFLSEAAEEMDLAAAGRSDDCGPAVLLHEGRRFAEEQ